MLQQGPDVYQLRPDVYRGLRAWVSRAVRFRRKIGGCSQSNCYLLLLYIRLTMKNLIG